MPTTTKPAVSCLKAQPPNTFPTILYYFFVGLLCAGCVSSSPHRACRKATIPEYKGSYLCGVRKANPAWWLANTDSPLPDWWQPDLHPDKRLRSWNRRNPLHNFTHYIIGISDRDFCRYGINPDGVWGPYGINATVLHTGPIVLPFLSLQSPWIEAYAGWRDRGNFGLALRRRD